MRRARNHLRDKEDKSPLNGEKENEPSSGDEDMQSNSDRKGAYMLMSLKCLML